MELISRIDGQVCWNSNRRLPFIICRPRKTNFRFPFAANKEILSSSFSSVFSVCVYILIFIFIFICCRSKWKMENRSSGDFLNPFTVCSPCKWKFVICPFVDEETKGSYPFANEQNGLNGLACRELATSLLTVKPVGVYSTTLVQYLYISCFLSDNKPVLSYLLLRLLPHACLQSLVAWHRNVLQAAGTVHPEIMNLLLDQKRDILGSMLSTCLSLDP